MIHLINGRGQLGRELEKFPLAQYPKEAYIYHTWNLDNKSKGDQVKEYEKFKIFVDNHTSKKIIFISTYSTKENWYNHYKQMSEAYLLMNCDNGIVIRLPTLIGKGILRKFKNENLEAYGEMELISISDAAIKIFEKIGYNGVVKSFRIAGEIIQAKTVKEIIRSQNGVKENNG